MKKIVLIGSQFCRFYRKHGAGISLVSREASGSLQSWQGKGGAGMSMAKSGAMQGRSHTLLHSQISCKLRERVHLSSRGWPKPFMRHLLPWFKHLPPGPTSNIGDYISKWDLGRDKYPNDIIHHIVWKKRALYPTWPLIPFENPHLEVWC